MTSPVAAITTVRYDATYQCAGLTLSNPGSGAVPNAPPMISIVTTGNANTNVNTSGSRVISFSSARTSRPTAVVLIATLPRIRSHQEAPVLHRRPGPAPPQPAPAQAGSAWRLPDRERARSGLLALAPIAPGPRRRTRSCAGHRAR